MEDRELLHLEERLTKLIAAFQKVRDDRNELLRMNEDKKNRIAMLEGELERFRAERSSILQRVTSLIEKIDRVEPENYGLPREDAEIATPPQEG